MRKWIDRLGGRKWALTLLVLVLATIIDLVTTRGLSASWVQLAIGLVGAYSVSNAITHYGHARGAADRGDPPRGGDDVEGA